MGLVLLVPFCRTPEEFAEVFDGFSVGSNDLAQFTLGVDRNSGTLADLFREDDPAVKCSFRELVESLPPTTPAGRCGYLRGRPSTVEAYVEFLLNVGLGSVS